MNMMPLPFLGTIDHAFVSPAEIVSICSSAANWIMVETPSAVGTVVTASLL